MWSVNLVSCLSVLIFIFDNTQEAYINSEWDGATQIHLTDFDFSTPEHLKVAVASLSQTIVQLREETKEEIHRVKEEAREEIQRVEEEVREEIQRVKQEANEKIKEEIQKVRQEANLQFPTSDAKYQKLEEELHKSNNEITTLKRIASGIPSLDSLGSDFSHRSRTVRHIEPFKTFVAPSHYSLEEFLRLMVPLSCYDWLQQGFTISGHYLIDPDGRGMGEPPFKVYCDMVSGYTLVHHDSEETKPTDRCTGAKCYKRTVKYTATDQQMLTLMALSASCDQYIKVECLESPLRKDGEALSTWTDRQGREQQYWVGSGDSYTCSCGLTNSCNNTREACNCDADVDGVTLSDQGYMSNMSSLPVKQLRFGSLEDKPLQMNYTLGPLRCLGSRPVSSPRSCKDLLVSGQHQSGYYFLNTNGAVDLVYCNIKEMYLSMNSDAQPTMRYKDFSNIKDFKEKLHDHKADEVTLSLEIKKMKVEQEDQKKSQLALSVEIEEMKGEREGQKEYQEELSGKIKEVKEDLDDHKEYQEELSGKIKEVKEDLDDHKEYQEKLSRNIKETNEKVEQHEDTQEMLKSQLLGMKRELQEELEEYKDKRVAFSAWLSSDYVRTESRIIFDRTSLNIGGGYNTANGIFTVPVDGLYYISVHLLKYYGVHGLKAKLRRNGSILGGLYVHHADKWISQPAISIVETFKAGDRLDVYLIIGKVSYSLAGTIFNGFLIK